MLNNPENQGEVTSTERNVRCGFHKAGILKKNQRKHSSGILVYSAMSRPQHTIGSAMLEVNRNSENFSESKPVVTDGKRIMGSDKMEWYFLG